MRRRPALTLAALAWLLWCEAGLGAQTARTSQTSQTGTQDLKRMSLEDLLDVEITTVSRTPEQTQTIPAALFVITSDDIRRSGARSLPDALRLAPGLQVAQIDGSTWAIGTRGFGDRLSRAMLVLIDGRAVYTPLFAGTYWEVQDTLLEDVDRIEVIRGPGGTLWGANAVNGIINIITKDAARTQGLFASAEAGAYGHGLGALRYGGTARGGRLFYRFYGKAFQRAHEYQPAGTPYDESEMGQVGGRADWKLSNQRTFTLQGDGYHERLGERQTTTFYTPPYREVTAVKAPLGGGNVLARLSGPAPIWGGRFQLQTYYDRTMRDEQPVGETRNTFDVDYQQTPPARGRHQVTFGAGYRITSGVIDAIPPSALIPERRTDNLFSGFAQDEIAIVAQRLRASVGAKVEHNSYSGFELQPSARLVWTPRPGQTVFWSATRAVRTPSRVETDYTTTSLVSPTVPTFVRLEMNPSFEPEKLVAYETGYRVRALERVYVTLSGFYNDLDDILSTELQTAFVERAPAQPARLILPVQFRNGLFGESHGGEITADVRPSAWLRATGNYSYLKVSMTPDPGARDVSQERRYEDVSPRHQVQLQAAVDLPARVSADLLVRHASQLDAGPVPAYTTSSVRVGWELSSRVELAVIGLNLNDAHHLEWPGALEIQRSVYAKVTLRR